MSCKISVITVVYNAVATMEKTMLSVVNQNYDYFEFVVIDGGSTDGTIDIIKKYHGRITYWVSELDNGIYDAMNKGIRVSKGDFIIFMNAGDTFLYHNVIEKFVESISGQESWSDIYYGNIYLDVESRRFISKPKELRQLLYRMPFCHQSVFCSSQLLKQNLFSERYKLASDFLFFREAYLKKLKFSYMDIDVCSYDLTGVSITRYYSYLVEMYDIIVIHGKSSLTTKVKSLIGLFIVNLKFLLKFSLRSFWRSIDLRRRFFNKFSH